MNKQEILKIYKNEADKLLISKIIDKIEARNFKKKLVYTDFLNEVELLMAQKLLNRLNVEDYTIFGGFETSQRKCIIFYTDEYDISTVFAVIKITPSKEQEYNHRDYLSAIIKLGVKREKIGDIIVKEEYTYIIALKELEQFLYSNLPNLTRFDKSTIEVIDINDLEPYETKKQEFTVIIASTRLDAIVAELAKTSRTKACEIINQGRVLVNYKEEYKNTKKINENDFLTIRGKGKFEIGQILGNTKNGNIKLLIKKYV